MLFSGVKTIEVEELAEGKGCGLLEIVEVFLKVRCWGPFYLHSTYINSLDCGIQDANFHFYADVMYCCVLSKQQALHTLQLALS